MKLLLDFFPLIGFFVGYYAFDIYVATILLMAASVLQTLVHRVTKKSFETMHLITLAIALVFGGLTLFLQDDTFIKLKVTFFMWLITLVFIARQLFSNKITLRDFLEGVSGESFGVAETTWKKLNVIWALVAFLVGLLNLWVAYNFSQEVWVNFKVWGVLVIQFSLMIVTVMILFNQMPEEKRKAMEQTSDSED
ncbi:MAG: inner membrane-spanning protein YciB [Kangiellaceae bacterium]|jgi:intracellular septation protein|nr:inner membrane-spanning protein YciB [Kangiellaceae bacterium]